MQAPGGPDEDRDGGFEYAGWSFPYFSEDMGEVINDAFAKAAAILLGRRTYEIFAASWPKFPDKDDPVASRLNTLPKYVVSTTLQNAGWEPTTIIRGDVPAEVAKLKDQYPGEIQVHGSAGLAQTLHSRGLIDEYRLFIEPVVLGTGKRTVRTRRRAHRAAAGRQQAHGQGRRAGHLPARRKADLRRVQDGGGFRPL